MCRLWNAYARSPVLWYRVEVKLLCHRKSQNEIATLFAQQLPPHVVSLKIDFSGYTSGIRLYSEVLCLHLKERCPHLNTLSIHHASFSNRLYWIIDSCGRYLPNLKELILHKCLFGDEPMETSVGRISKIQLLEVSMCLNVGRFKWFLLAKLPCLKKFNVLGLRIADWFRKDYCKDFLGQLKVLHVGWTDLSYETFKVLLNSATNLTVLFLCCTKLKEDSFSFNVTSLPNLQKLCLRYCRDVTCESVLALVQSCPSLKTVYVNPKIATLYAEHPSVRRNPAKLAIVQTIQSCRSHVLTWRD